MYGERSYAYAAKHRVSPRQGNDEWSSERPWQPGRQLDCEERQPRVMSAFRMHDEYRLTCVE